MDTRKRELEFVGTLGTGGFGAVYLANLRGRDRFLRRVAVKVMREGLESTPDLVARQKDEARLLGLLAHDAIVQVLDLAEVGGRPAVVMEYVEGVDLAQILKSAPAPGFPVRAALEVVHAAASALDAAYSTLDPTTRQPLRVIHRDIKPANLLVTVHGRAKVLDFGVAKADFWREGHTTQGGYGTPRFMAPEQWLGEPYGAPVDIYALGVTLYEMVSPKMWERPPLARAAFEHHVGALLDAAAQHPEGKGVPEPVLALIARMTAFDQEDRPTAADVHELVEVALVDAPGESLARFARRVVPPLIAVRTRDHAAQPLPAVVTLSGISKGETVPPEDPSMVPSGSQRPVTATRPARVVPLVALGLGATAAAFFTLVLLGVLFSPGARVLLPGLSQPEQKTAEVTPAEVLAEKPPAPPEPEPEPRGTGTEGPPVEPEPEIVEPPDPPPVKPPEVKKPVQVVAAKPAAPAPAPVPTTQVSFSASSLSTPVLVDGKVAGKTPFTVALPNGPHKVAVDDGGLVELVVDVGSTTDPLRLRYESTAHSWKTQK